MNYEWARSLYSHIAGRWSKRNSSINGSAFVGFLRYDVYQNYIIRLYNNLMKLRIVALPTMRN